MSTTVHINSSVKAGAQKTSRSDSVALGPGLAEADTDGGSLQADGCNSDFFKNF